MAATGSAVETTFTRIWRTTLEQLKADPQVGLLVATEALAVVVVGWSLLTPEQQRQAMAEIHARQQAASNGALDGDGPLLDPSDRDAVDEPAEEDIDAPPSERRCKRRRQPTP